MDNISSNLNDIFMEPAKTTGMYKKKTVQPQKIGNQKQTNHGSMRLVKNPRITTYDSRIHYQNNQ